MNIFSSAVKKIHRAFFIHRENKIHRDEKIFTADDFFFHRRWNLIHRRWINVKLLDWQWQWQFDYFKQIYAHLPCTPEFPPLGPVRRIRNLSSSFKKLGRFPPGKSNKPGNTASTQRVLQRCYARHWLAPRPIPEVRCFEILSPATLDNLSSLSSHSARLARFLSSWFGSEREFFRP